ncbi:MAG: hypothetical protein Q9216_001353 [Gyalolechia sp. 2 TL-2023]
MAPRAQFTGSVQNCLRCSIRRDVCLAAWSRHFQTSAARKIEVSIDAPSSAPEVPPPRRPLDPNTVATPKLERRLVRTTGQQPIGSRRRRAALRISKNIPFEQLPYQCFQEARKLLLADREEKLKQIEEEQRRIAKAQSIPAEQHGGEYIKKGRVLRMQKYLEKLKILADINDPVVKKRFEDGFGDLNRPIYRFLADQQWRKQRRLILMQRVNQMHVVPDVVPYVDPTAEVKVAFGRRNIQPGDFVDSRTSEIPPRLNVQLFERGERFVSVVVMDPDVPNLETDGFDSRCHFVAVNVLISPVSPLVSLSALSGQAHILRPWLPPHAQKGSPYHRLAILVYEQKDGRGLEADEIEKLTTRYKEQFSLRSFTQNFQNQPIGVHLFRTVWDDSMAGVMQRAGIEGANIELKRKKAEKLPYKKKDAIASDLHPRAETFPASDDVQRLFDSQLSKNAAVFFPNSPQFGNLTDRWSAFTDGNLAVVIEPASTEDIVVAVKLANRFGLPFLAVNGGHGTTSSLNTIKRGVSINLRALNHVQVSQDGQSALIGGGANTHEVINTLAASGKVTATTNGGCTGHVGPALGGGFGRYRGFFGLVLDNIIDMTVVLADGTITHVSSTSNPDLYWAMKGAGQNFGIVAEANFKIYDPPTSSWFYAELTFADAEHLIDPLFEAMNQLNSNGPQPKELGSVYPIYAINPQYSKTDPIILLQFSYAGTPEQAQPWLDLFTNLRPTAMFKRDSLLSTEIQTAASQDIDSPVCAHGSTWRLFPLGLKTYNATANRAVFNLYKQFIGEHPEFSGSVVQFENYASGGMRAIDAASTAYAHRDDDILVDPDGVLAPNLRSFAPVYAPSKASDAIASDFANKARQIWHAGDTPGRHVTAYLNYANGDESLEALYGYETWRLGRLRGLKKQYDPYNRFRFFNPIRRSHEYYGPS